MNTSRFVFNKTTPQNTVRPLKDYLDGQKEILEKLEKVIQAEYESLKDRHLENLKTLSEMKSDLMLKLQSNDQRIKLHPEVAKLHTEFLPEVTIIKNMMKSVSSEMKLTVSSSLCVCSQLISCRRFY